MAWLRRKNYKERRGTAAMICGPYCPAAIDVAKHVDMDATSHKASNKYCLQM